jgi:L-asparagine oxygenase
LGMLVGHAISLSHFRNGERIHNIYPMPDDAGTQKASNSTRLELHTEMAFQESAPDALAILCLRASASPPTTGFCDMRSLWNTLGAEEQLLLQETEFSFRYTGPDKAREFFDLRCPLAKPEPGGLRFQYDFGAGGVTPEHDDALTVFRERMASSVSELTLAAGDLVLIDNRRMVHGRSPMSPDYAGGERWLQRCLLRLHPPASATA